jgi:hypothetical protein
MGSKKIKRDYAAERAAAEAQQAANNMQKNFAADLKNENLSNVVPGGSEELDPTGTANPQRRRRQVSGGSLSSQLGINS